MFRFQQFVIEDDACAMKVGTDGVLLGAWARLGEEKLVVKTPIDSEQIATAPPNVQSDQEERCSMRDAVPSSLELITAKDKKSTNEKVQAVQRCLDIGAGSGLISVMLAQRFPAAQLFALEIDASAAAQAAENAKRSPFGERITVCCADFIAWIEAALHIVSTKGEARITPDPAAKEQQAQLDSSAATVAQWDAIVSNPPFFEETLHSPQAQRAQARHTAAGLSFEILTRGSAALLREGGSLQVILPATAESRFVALAQTEGLQLYRRCWVRTVQRKPPKRVLLHFVKSKNYVACESSELVLNEGGQRSADYVQLCADFYL